MRYDQIVRAKEGTQRHILKVEDAVVPDVWHVFVKMKGTVKSKKGVTFTKKEADMVHETWVLCHDLLKHIQRVCKEPDTRKK